MKTPWQRVKSYPLHLIRDRVRTQVYGQLTLWPIYAFRTNDDRRYTYDTPRRTSQ